MSPSFERQISLCSPCRGFPSDPTHSHSIPFVLYDIFRGWLIAALVLALLVAAIVVVIVLVQRKKSSEFF